MNKQETLSSISFQYYNESVQVSKDMLSTIVFKKFVILVRVNSEL